MNYNQHTLCPQQPHLSNITTQITHISPVPYTSTSKGRLVLTGSGQGQQRPRLSRAASADIYPVQLHSQSPTVPLSIEALRILSAAEHKHPRGPTRRINERSHSISSSTSSSSFFSSGSSCSSWPSEHEADVEHEQQKYMVFRKNKTLPPPTLSPILMPSIPHQVTKRSARSDSPSRFSVSSWSKDSCASSSSSFGGSDSEDDPLSDAWPKIEKIRIRSRYPDESADNASSSQSFVSELPPPPSLYHDSYHCDDSVSSRKYLALSASIWGPGWHQVEPLPASFVKTMEQTELEAQALAQEKAGQVAANPRTKAKKAKQQAKAAAASASASASASAAAAVASSSVEATPDEGVSLGMPISTETFVLKPTSSIVNMLCSARLPRSLQFVD